ncbi:MAG: type transporter [Bryobacterales bacterium]|jgi:ABC-2 type transport system permease protein|nr:type transporter [Bryobacterales bacterium]
MNFRRARAMARKELLHILRDPRSLMAALTQPVLVLLLFGYALSLDVDRIPTMIYDADRTVESQNLIHEFRGSRYFQIVDEVDSYRPIERAMDERRILVGVAIPPDYSRDLLQGKDSPVQILLDGSDSNTASIAMGYAEGLVQTYARHARESAQSLRTGSVLQPPVDARVRVWYNTDLVSRNFIVPGLIGVITMIIAALLTSLTIAREWENGTMEQLLSTPVRPAEMALGKLSAHFLLGLVDMLIALFVGVVIFKVPLKGSPVLLLFSACVFLYGALAWGLFISAMFRNQLAAYQMGTLTSFLPAFLLSGFIYPISNMPWIIRAISVIIPARYFIDMTKGIFLKGVGLRILWFDLLLLILYAVGVSFLAIRKLRQKIA